MHVITVFEFIIFFFAVSIVSLMLRRSYRSAPRDAALLDSFYFRIVES